VAAPNQNGEHKGRQRSIGQRKQGNRHQGIRTSDPLEENPDEGKNWGKKGKTRERRRGHVDKIKTKKEKFATWRSVRSSSRAAERRRQARYSNAVVELLTKTSHSQITPRGVHCLLGAGREDPEGKEELEREAAATKINQLQGSSLQGEAASFQGQWPE